MERIFGNWIINPANGTYFRKMDHKSGKWNVTLAHFIKIRFNGPLKSRLSSKIILNEIHI